MNFKNKCVIAEGTIKYLQPQAKEYIYDLHTDMLNRIDELEKKNDLLREQLRSLEHSKTTIE